MGLQAERCDVTPTMVENQAQFRNYRVNSEEERKKVTLNKGKLDDKSLPTADMTDKIVQHRIHSDYDMKQHHEAVLDSNYWRKDSYKKHHEKGAMVGDTGSMANCTIDTKDEYFADDDHLDAGFLTAYCHRIRYRIPVESFIKAGSVIIGILSSAGGDGPSRRNSIRETWAHNRESVFFLVAGPWSAISEEYETQKDLVWIDEEEVYDGERSVLTFKTASFVSIVHILSTQLHKTYDYIFKTDDDSYVDLVKLRTQLYASSHEPYDYWGWCQTKNYPPLRGSESKWSISNESYPEPMYPKYCQGAGFAVSRKFATCMAGRGSLAQARFMPFEDVAMGLQAERCNVTPTMVENQAQFRNYRVNSEEERKKVTLNKGKLDDKSLPTADMTDKIVQHRIHSDYDMKQHHEAVLDPNYWRKDSYKKHHKTKTIVETIDDKTKMETGSMANCTIDTKDVISQMMMTTLMLDFLQPTV